MYSNKDNVNILTSLLIASGVRQAVVCPGSRNAPIVHNFHASGIIACHSVTDERSAGFYALGMAQALSEPVVVCVTSGTALLGLSPAVAEACYQHQPLIVVSADRPQQWIDQLDGQTLLQQGVFGSLVAKSVTLPEPHNDEERWYCNRLVNEALLSLPACIHINVPISEPLFSFDSPSLPVERLIDLIRPGVDYDCLPPQLLQSLSAARRPMVVFGQMAPDHFSGDGLDYLFSHVIVLHESTSPVRGVSHFDEVLHFLATDEERSQPMLPDVVIYAGGTIVSKRLRHFLRKASGCEVWRINDTGQVEDTFQHLRGIVLGDAESVLQSLSYKLSKSGLTAESAAYRRRWLQLLGAVSRHAAAYEPSYSQMAVVKRFETMVADAATPTAHAHYANSSAIRLANIYAKHHVWCNRGVNGIEGSLSTAAGFSIVAASPLPHEPQPLVFCVIGDLSFFYDANALWNGSLQGNLRIILLNNGQGGIFNMLPGLSASTAHPSLIAAAHATTAEGICLQNHVDYFAAHSIDEVEEGLSRLTDITSAHPALLEVFTSAETDGQILRDYYASCRQVLEALACNLK